MKILTKSQKEKLIQNYKKTYSKPEPDGAEHKPVVKLFGGSSCTWLLTELEPDSDIAFGLCDIGQGCAELGSVSLNELMAIRFPPFGLPIERDFHFEANKSIGEYAKEARELGYIKT
jgi:hypothetical protein